MHSFESAPKIVSELCLGLCVRRLGGGVHIDLRFINLSWELRERRPRFWGGAGEARLRPRLPKKRVARQRTQYAVNFFLTYWLRSLFFAGTSSRSANSHIFGLLGSRRSCLIGSDNSYHFCEKLLSYHKGYFLKIAFSLFFYSYNLKMLWWETLNIVKIHFPAVTHE